MGSCLHFLAAIFLLLTVCASGQQQASAVGSSKAADSILLEARQIADGDSPSKAEEIARGYLELHPHAAEGYFLLGYVLFREIQVEGAQSRTDAGVPQGFLAVRDAKARASLAEYTEGARYHTPSAFDLKIVALDYILLDDYSDADTWLSKSLTWAPEDAQSWYYEGRIRFKEAKYKDAVAAFQQALKLNPRSVEAEDNLGLTYQAMSLMPEAAAAFKEAIDWKQTTPSNDNGPWLDLGILLTQEQRTSEAISYLVEAVKRAPADVRAHEALAAAYRSVGRWPEARAEFEQAVKLAPDSASLHFQLGQAYRRTGALEQAKAEFARSSALEARGAAPTVQPSTP